MKYYLSLALVMLLLVSCKNETKTKIENTAEIHKVIAQEVLNVKGYSYVRFLEDGMEKWIAAPTTDVKVGETYYFGKSMEMKNFKSKELDKTFETVYFIDKISNTEEGITQPQLSSQVSGNKGSKRAIVEKKEITIEASANTISIEELFKNKEKYNYQTVRLKGEVTKYNPAIMDINWFHIQDGTAFNEKYDLTATTEDEVNLGDIVTFEGKVILNKNFGSGYVYDVLIENATILK